MSKILIIEDELSIQKLLSYDLKQAGFDVDVASNGLEGYKKAKEEVFDLILLDLMLPGMDGIEICQKLRTEGINTYIIILTAREDEFDKIVGLDAGADDYMTKPFSPREVLARVKAGIRRQKFNQEESSNNVILNDLRIDLDRHEVYIKDNLVPLTFKEFELLAFLTKNKGIALSRDVLLETLWGFEYDGDTRIVDVHIFKLREKLIGSSVNIITKRGLGYMLEETNNENH